MAISTEAAFQCDWMTTVWCYGMTSMPLGCGIHSNNSNPTKRLESTFMKSTYSRSCGKQSLKMTQVSGKKNMEKIVSRLYTQTSTWSSSQSYQSAMVGSPARLQAAPWLRQVCQASADSCKLFSSRVRSTRPAWRQGFYFERHALRKVSQVEAIFCLCPMVTHDGTLTNFPFRKTNITIFNNQRFGGLICVVAFENIRAQGWSLFAWLRHQVLVGKNKNEFLLGFWGST